MLCMVASFKERLLHDFRRISLRSIVRGGVPERMAMAISDHETRSAFERYSIVNEAELKKASRRVKEHYQEIPFPQNGHNWGTVRTKEQIKEEVRIN
jgi:hypothetical protein